MDKQEREEQRRLAEADGGLPRSLALIKAPDHIDALELDAERYRCVRKQLWESAEFFVITGSKSQIKIGTYCPSFEQLDDVVDATIAINAALTQQRIISRDN